MGAAREDAEEVAAPSSTVSSILPRRILFHPPLRDTPPSFSSSLTPLNAPTPDPALQHSNGDRPAHSSIISRESSSQASPALPCALVKRIGAGLNNLGNTCFLNSVLQCLAHTPPLATYFQEGLHKSTCRAVTFCAMCALESHVKQALSAPGRVISPTYLVKNLRCISRSFQVGRQEDAHEYMRYLIEALQKCCPPDVHVKASPNAQNNFIQKVFGGRFQSQVKCTECANSSNTYDPFLDLSLDIVKAESLLKALSRFMAIEVLDGENKYFCSKCKKKVRAHKQFTIDQAPHVLTVQFKRFSSSGNFGEKIDKKVQFERTLNLTPFVNCKDKGARYCLYGVLVHAGWSTHSGHYFCFVRTASDIWHRLDDYRVSQVSEKIVLEQKAYILFYIRDFERAPVSNANHLKEASEKTKVSQTTSFLPKVETNNANVNITATQIDSTHAKDNGKDAVRVNANGLGTPNGTPQRFEGPAKEWLMKPPIITTLFRTSKVAAPACEEGIDDKPIHTNNLLGNGYMHKNKDVQGNNGVTARAIVSSEVPFDNGFSVPEASSENRMKEHKRKPGSDKLAIDAMSDMNISSNEKSKLSLPLSNAAAFQPVPRWEDSGHNVASAAEANSVLNDKLAHCGHVLDEWDEEYDRGKQKKLRNKTPLQQDTSEISEHLRKRRKHVLGESSNNNLFQAYAATRGQLDMKTIPLKKLKKRERIKAHRLFLKRHRFRQLPINRHHRRKR